MDEFAMVAAGRLVPDAVDRIRRYCGRTWSGGPPETWAWHYYDGVPTQPDDVVTATDVLCAAALHPGLSRDDLTFFRSSADDVSAWLGKVPADRGLWELEEQAVDHLTELPSVLRGPSVSLLSKVLHRKRPHVIPLLDRHVVDWYRPVTGKRAAPEAWAALVYCLRAEQVTGDQRRRLERVCSAVCDGGDPLHLSWIRAVDIAIWMGSR